MHIRLPGIQFRCLSVSLFGFREFVRLRIRIPQKVQQHRRWRMRGDSLEQRNGFRSFAFIHQQLRQLLHRRFISRVVLQNASQHLFGFIMLVLQPVEPRQPQSGFRVRGIQPMNLAVLLDGPAHRFRLSVARTDIAQASQINPSQQPP